MKFKFIFILIIIPFYSWSQFGINLSYDNQSAEDWENINMDSDSLGMFDQFASISLFYWWRPENIRIELLPELGYRRNLGSVPQLPLAARTHSVDLNLNADFYVFDLMGDCDCPTFSKEGNLVTKGLFIEISPGVSYRSYEIESAVNGELKESVQSSSGFLGIIGVGAGLDIGISDLLTITPWIKNEWHLGANWEDFSSFSNVAKIENEKTNLSYLRFGIRLGFRPDYKSFR